MSGAKLAFKIDPAIFKELKTIQRKLPEEATGVYKEGAVEAYDSPAGLALLGVKDGMMDRVVNLAMSGGCWDAPNVNHKDFDKGFRKMIEEDRIVQGMALIRHPHWDENDGEDDDGNIDHSHDAKIPTHLKYEIRHLSKTFADITNTAWIILHNDYFRIYRPTKDEEGRIKVLEIPGVRLFDDEAKEDKIIKEKFHFDGHKKAIRAEAKKERERIARERQAYEERRLKAAQERNKKKLDDTNSKLKEGKDSVIDAGHGMSFVKNKEGKYILWQTST